MLKDRNYLDIRRTLILRSEQEVSRSTYQENENDFTGILACSLLSRKEFCTNYSTFLVLSRKNAEVCEMRTVKLLCIGRRDKFQIEPWKGNMKGLSNKSRLKVGIKSPTAFVTFYSYISECDNRQNSVHGLHINVTVVQLNILSQPIRSHF